MKKNCTICGKQFSKPPTRSKKSFMEKAKYCSEECKHLGWKGRQPWNKGLDRSLDGRIAQPWLGKKRDPETIKKLQEGRKKVKGEKHPGFQKDNPSYRAVHGWLAKYWTKTGVCEHCNNEKNKSGKTQWANIENYDRFDREDWYELCSSCHKVFDLNKLTNSNV